MQAPQLNFWTGFLFAGALHDGVDALGGATGFHPADLMSAAVTAAGCRR